MTHTLLPFMLALAACAFLSSCAATHPVTGKTPPSTHTEIVCGKTALLAPGFLDGCPNGSGACATVVDGQYWILQYPLNDLDSLAHEKDHVCGMEHREPWVHVGFLGTLGCAEVTAGGQTSWRPGDVMCRAQSGVYYKETDLSRISRVRALQHRVTPAPSKTPAH